MLPQDDFNMTATLCINRCQLYGYNAAGIEVGTQCCESLSVLCQLHTANGFSQSVVMLRTFSLLQILSLQQHLLSREDGNTLSYLLS
jgi:hypothetical protein